MNQPLQPSQGESEINPPITPGGFGQVLDAPEPEGDDGDTVTEQARTSASCCAAPGQRPFSPTTAGGRPTGGTSGLGSIFRVSGLKAREKSPSRSIARGRSMRANWVSSRRRFAPFSKGKGPAGCMCSTSIPRSIGPRFIKLGSRSHLPGWWRRNELRAVLPLVERARNCASDLGFPYRFMW